MRDIFHKRSVLRALIKYINYVTIGPYEFAPFVSLVAHHELVQEPRADVLKAKLKKNGLDVDGIFILHCNMPDSQK